MIKDAANAAENQMADRRLGRKIHPMLRLSAVSFVLVVALTPSAHSGSYEFAEEALGIDIVTHPIGYSGTGGVINLTVGIDPTSANASDMEISVQNIVATFNALTPTTGNLIFGASNNIPPTDIDFESVALHELGHSLGLGHENLATDSGVSGADQNYTKTTDGVNNAFELGIGADGVRGSTDDVRGDDVNLYWFRKSNNNPFTIAGTVDGSTYSRLLSDLPGGHTFAANGDRDVSTLFGVSGTESVMQQGSFFDEAQRTLTHGDVAMLKLAQTGLDRTANTLDDYTMVLSYAGLTTSADIVLDFDNAETGFAVSQFGGTFLSGDNIAITTTAIYFNTGFDWFFNDVLLGPLDLDNVYVTFGGANGDGTESSPFNNLEEALGVADANAIIHIAPGTSPETFTGGSEINQDVTLVNTTGASNVVIGSGARRGADDDSRGGFVSRSRKE